MESKSGFTFSLLAGIIGILSIIMLLLLRSIPSLFGSSERSFLDFFMILFGFFNSFILIVSAFLMKSQSKVKAGAILSLIFGFLAFFGGTFFAGILGIVGGIMGLNDSGKISDQITNSANKQVSKTTNENLEIFKDIPKKSFWAIRIIYVASAFAIFSFLSGGVLIGLASPLGALDQEFFIFISLLLLCYISIFLLGYVGFAIEKKSKFIWSLAFIFGLVLFTFGVYNSAKFFDGTHYFFLSGFLIFDFIPFIFGLITLFALMNFSMLRYYFGESTKKVFIISSILVVFDLLLISLFLF